MSEKLPHERFCHNSLVKGIGLGVTTLDEDESPETLQAALDHGKEVEPKITNPEILERIRERRIAIEKLLAEKQSKP